MSTPLEQAITSGARVAVYRNLRLSSATRTVWSVVDVKPNGRRAKLIGTTERVALRNATPFVDASAARRVASPGAHREVCAWIIGELATDIASGGAEVTYNRDALRFEHRDGTGRAYTQSWSATFTDRMRAQS